MTDTNPLNLSPMRLPVINKSGRPVKDSVINFGPQPQSFISQLLKNLKEKKIHNDQIKPTPKVSVTQKQKLITNDDLTTDNPLEESYLGATNEKPCVKTPRNAMLKEKVYACDYLDCTYSTRISSNLSKHKRRHSSEKPYLCDTCSFQTKFVNSLKTHKRIHTNVRPYTCDFCSYSCNSSSNLKKHCKHMHSNKLLNT